MSEKKKIAEKIKEKEKQQKKKQEELKKRVIPVCLWAQKHGGLRWLSVVCGAEQSSGDAGLMC